MNEMPTIRELMKRIGCNIQSVKYGNSRCVLNHLDEPVVAYGYGYAGFMAIFTDHYGFPRSVCYSVKNILHSYQEASFATIDHERVLKELKENKLLVDRDIDQEALDKATEKEKFERPVIGKVKINNHYNSHSNKNSYIIYGLKNGGFRVYMEFDQRVYKYFTPLEDFLSILDKTEKYKEDDSSDRYELVENTLPDETLKKMRMIVAARAL